MFLPGVSDQMSREDRIAALVQQLDDLLGEAAQLRDEVTTAVRARADRPFWPDRRQNMIPHEPDRRAR
jgi:hypothetical protein